MASKPKALPKPVLAAPKAPAKVVELFPDSSALMAERGMPRWAREMTAEIAVANNVSLADMLGSSRSRNIVIARQEAWYRLKTSKSPITGLVPSYPQIADWFGREHTGVLYGVAKYAHDNGLPLDTQYNLEAAMERKRKRALAHRHKRNPSA